MSDVRRPSTKVRTTGSLAKSATQKLTLRKLVLSTPNTQLGYDLYSFSLKFTYILSRMHYIMQSFTEIYLFVFEITCC